MQMNPWQMTTPILRPLLLHVSFLRAFSEVGISENKMLRKSSKQKKRRRKTKNTNKQNKTHQTNTNRIGWFKCPVNLSWWFRVKTTNSLKSKQKLLRKWGPFWLHNIWFLLQCYTLNLCSLSLQTGFFEGHILSWTDEISEEWPSGVNRFSTHITHLFPQPPLNNFQPLLTMCSPWLYCAAQVSVTTSVTIVSPWSHSQLLAHLVFGVSPSLQAKSEATDTVTVGTLPSWTGTMGVKVKCLFC